MRQTGREKKARKSLQREFVSLRGRGNYCVMERNGGRQTAGGHSRKVYTRLTKAEPKRHDVENILLSSHFT